MQIQTDFVNLVTIEENSMIFNNDVARETIANEKYSGYKVCDHNRKGSFFFLLEKYRKHHGTISDG